MDKKQKRIADQQLMYDESSDPVSPTKSGNPDNSTEEEQELFRIYPHYPERTL